MDTNFLRIHPVAHQGRDHQAGRASPGTLAPEAFPQATFRKGDPGQQAEVWLPGVNGHSHDDSGPHSSWRLADFTAGSMATRDATASSISPGTCSTEVSGWQADPQRARPQGSALLLTLRGGSAPIHACTPTPQTRKLARALPQHLPESPRPPQVPAELRPGRSQMVLSASMADRFSSAGNSRLQDLWIRERISILTKCDHRGKFDFIRKFDHHQQDPRITRITPKTHVMKPVSVAVSVHGEL